MHMWHVVFFFLIAEFSVVLMSSETTSLSVSDSLFNAYWLCSSAVLAAAAHHCVRRDQKIKASLIIGRFRSIFPVSALIISFPLVTNLTVDEKLNSKSKLRKFMKCEI